MGQPIEIIPSNYYMVINLINRQAVLGIRSKTSSKLFFIILFLH
jgi:hypothetical protein